MSRRPSAFAPSALPAAIIGALPAIAAAVGFLALWELYADFSGIRPSILPAPSRVLAQGWINRQALIDNTWPTLSATLAGFGCSLAVAFVFSVLMDFARPVRRRAVSALRHQPDLAAGGNRSARRALVRLRPGAEDPA